MASQRAVDIAVDYSQRSLVVRDLLPHARPEDAGRPFSSQIVQFWDDREAVPADVASCMASWTTPGNVDIERLIFDDNLALEWIQAELGGRYTDAFRNARHPAMRSDYFRLCYLHISGGCYVDADDRLVHGARLPDLEPAVLYVAPLCYDKVAGGMTSPMGRRATFGDPDELIFYVNNNPIIAPAGHPVVASAMERATMALLAATGDYRDVQGMTGPGNLTAALVEHVVDYGADGAAVGLLTRWDEVCVSEWPLGYRTDERNWRIWASEGGVAT